MDKVSLIWSCFCVLVGILALLRSSAVGQAMKRIHSEAKMHQVLSEKELRERTTLYIRLFGVVWIVVGLGWIAWLLYHWKHPH